MRAKPTYRRKAYPLWRVFADKKQKSPSKSFLKGYGVGLIGIEQLDDYQ
jgi:hypothetical protein